MSIVTRRVSSTFAVAYREFRQFDSAQGRRRIGALSAVGRQYVTDRAWRDHLAELRPVWYGIPCRVPSRLPMTVWRAIEARITGCLRIIVCPRRSGTRSSSQPTPEASQSSLPGDPRPPASQYKSAIPRTKQRSSVMGSGILTPCGMAWRAVLRLRVGDLYGMRSTSRT